MLSKIKKENWRVCRIGKWFLKTEIGQAEENERWEVDDIIRTVTEDLIVDNLEFNDYIDDFAE